MIILEGEEANLIKTLKGSGIVLAKKKKKRPTCAKESTRRRLFLADFKYARGSGTRMEQPLGTKRSPHQTSSKETGTSVLQP